MKRLIIPLFLVFLLLILPAKEQVAEASTGGEPQLQVKLVNYLGNLKSISLRVTGSYNIEGKSTKLVSDKSYTVKAENSTINLYDGSTKIASGTEVSITPINNQDRAIINDREYLGSFAFTVENQVYVRPINKVYMEDYLKSVVPAEMYASWDKEALKVQAVAARTYAYFRMDKVINDTTSYQVYAGASKMHPNSNAAVDETVGEILTYNGSVIDALFSASNGGMTENNHNEFGSPALPYFPIQKDVYDTKIQWSFSIQKQQIDLTGLNLAQPDSWWNVVKEKDQAFTSNIKSWLRQNGYSNKEIKIISIPKLAFYNKTESGRVERGDLSFTFLVKDTYDSTGKLNLQTENIAYAIADKIRSFIGRESVMTSTLISTANETSQAYYFAGTGNGHGVGMSQHGVNNRVNAGQKYQYILGFYYPGTKVIKQYDAHPITPSYKPIKVQLNGKDFSQGYFGNNTTYVNWNALKSFKIPYTYTGNGVFKIEGQTIQGIQINNDWYIQWKLLSPGKMSYQVIDGGYNFIYTTPIKIQLSGKDFTNGGYFRNNTTYIHWNVLKKLNIPYEYKGNGVFVIKGRTIQGEAIKGDWYIQWKQLSPGNITYKEIRGGYNFIYTIPIKIQLSGRDFTSGGYFLNNTTYIHWNVLKKMNIPYEYKGNGVFVIKGRTIQGEAIKGDWYIQWKQLSPGNITYKQISGGYDFIYNIPIKIQLSSRDFTNGGYFRNNTTYIQWNVLKKLNIPYEYKGNGVFVIKGRTIQGEAIKGDWYIQWKQLSPGNITYKEISGGYNFIYNIPIQIQLNGKVFNEGGFFRNNTTYIHWNVLKAIKVPYTYKGDGVFIIEGRNVKAEPINGNWYIRWVMLLPNKMSYKEISGGYNFIY